MKPHRPYPKEKTYTDKGYLEFIRGKKCLVCNKDSVPHHESGLGIGLAGGGTGKKCSDLAALPLCPECHKKRHDKGYITFWLEYAGIFPNLRNHFGRLIPDGVVMREVLKLLFEYRGKVT